MLRRLRQSLIVLVAAVTLTFVLARLAPGDPFLAANDQLSATDRAALLHEWGYDAPLWKQYALWGRNLLSGNLGPSHELGKPVTAVIGGAIGRSALLIIPALMLGFAGGIALGAWQASRPRHLLARTSGAAALAIVSLPDAVIALAVYLIVVVRWRLAPASGTVSLVHDSLSFAGRVGDRLQHAALPCVTLALLIAAALSRHQRTSTLLVLREDFVRATRATGASERRILWRHALRSSLGPVFALGGVIVPSVFAGAIFIERVFGWPGLGSALADAIARRDYAVIQAVALVGTLIATVAIAVSDLLSRWANPATAHSK